MTSANPTSPEMIVKNGCLRLRDLLKKFRKYSQMIMVFRAGLDGPDLSDSERADLTILLAHLMDESQRVVERMKTERRRLMIFSASSGLGGGDSDLRSEISAPDEPGRTGGGGGWPRPEIQ